jgi:FixJ family two-component response regulator
MVSVGRHAHLPSGIRPETTATAGRRTIAEMARAHGDMVFIVDDDQRVRESLSMLLSTFDVRPWTFGSAAEYLAYPRPDVPACLVLDVELPDISGLELQSRFTQGQLTAYRVRHRACDVPSSVRAMKSGAVDS